MSGAPPASYSYHLARQTADALRRQARQIIGVFIWEAENNVAKRTVSYGECVASATMLAFALELYLKSLLLLCRCPVPKTHNLVTLYRRLPDKQRQTILAIYDKSAEGFAPDACVISMSVGQGDEDDLHGNAALDASLEAVLDRCKDAFENWRYFHETAVDGGPRVSLRFEYQRLDWICGAIDLHIPAGTRVE